MESIARHVRELEQLLDQLPLDKIEQVISILQDARIKGKLILILGIGRYASMASRFAGDLCKIPHQRGMSGFKAIGLSESTPWFSSSVDGEDVEPLIVNQLDSLLSRGDILLVFSLSGNSKIVLRVIELANRRGAITIGFMGDDEGRLKSVVDVGICVATQCGEYIEDTYLIMQNLITQAIKEETLVLPTSPKAEQLLLKSRSNPHSSLFRSMTHENSAKDLTPERSRTWLELFNELSKELAYESELRDLLRRVLLLTLNKLHASSGTFVVLNEQYEAIEGAMVINGEARPYTLHQYADIIERGLAGWVVNNRQGALISNTRDDPRWLSSSWGEESGRVHSAICAPVIDNDRVVGILTLTDERPGRFSEEDLSLLAAVTMFITLVNYAL